jgi:MSHA pilin protein MshD
MSSRGERGLSLIELVVFIVVMGIALVAMMLVYSQFTRASVDPLIRKQALAIATTLLEEVQLQPFTYCDPDDSNVYTATGSPGGGCTTDEAIGPEAGGENRYGAPRFDNVNDYHGFAMAAGTIRTIDDATPIAQLADYSVGVTVQPIAANELGANVPAADALRITVTSTHAPTGTSVTLQGYRLRYAPNSP